MEEIKLNFLPYSGTCAQYNLTFESVNNGKKSQTVGHNVVSQKQVPRIRKNEVNSMIQFSSVLVMVMDLTEKC